MLLLQEHSSKPTNPSVCTIHGRANSGSIHWLSGAVCVVVDAIHIWDATGVSYLSPSLTCPHRRCSQILVLGKLMQPALLSWAAYRDQQVFRQRSGMENSVLISEPRTGTQVRRRSRCPPALAHARQPLLLPPGQKPDQPLVGDERSTALPGTRMPRQEHGPRLLDRCKGHQGSECSHREPGC